jgi:hypothetical protein
MVREAPRRSWHSVDMGYLGNLTCRDCGLTFTAGWGGGRSLDEYRCELDHVVIAQASTGEVVSIEGAAPRDDSDLVELRGLCPLCSSELAAGRLPRCPVCGGRDHDILISAVVS